MISHLVFVHLDWDQYEQCLCMFLRITGRQRIFQKYATMLRKFLELSQYFQNDVTLPYDVVTCISYEPWLQNGRFKVRFLFMRTIRKYILFLILKKFLMKYHTIKYQVAIAPLYEQVRCQLKTQSGFSKYFFK